MAVINSGTLVNTSMMLDGKPILRRPLASAPICFNDAMIEVEGTTCETCSMTCEIAKPIRSATTFLAGGVVFCFYDTTKGTMISS